MKGLLKKVAIIVIVVLSVNVTVKAQEKGDMAAGGNFVIGTGNGFTNYGIGAKFQYNVMDPLRMEGSFTDFFEKNLTSMWNLSVNGHWLFPAADQINVYPLAGLSIVGSANTSRIDLGEFSSFGGGSWTSVALNIGGGIDYNLTDKLFLNAELKYQICGELDMLLISAGLAYRF